MRSGSKCWKRTSGATRSSTSCACWESSQRAPRRRAWSHRRFCSRRFGQLHASQCRVTGAWWPPTQCC
ncbi:hypothetical protein IWW56_003844, partial [Coemansia sp. RSA 2131]